MNAFLVRSSCGECALSVHSVQVISVLSGPISWQVLDMFKTSNGRHRMKMSGGWTLLVRWYAVCPVLMRFVRFSCVRHPVGILYVFVDVRSTCVVNGKLQDMYWSSPDECRMCILWSFDERFDRFLCATYSFYPLYILYTYVSWPFSISYLSGTYALLTTSATTFTALPKPDKRFSHFSVRSASVTFIRWFVTAPLVLKLKDQKLQTMQL